MDAGTGGAVAPNMKIFLDHSRPAPDSSWVLCRTVDHAIFLIGNPRLEPVELVSVAHPLANETALDLVEWLKKQVRAGVRLIPKLCIHAADDEGRRCLEAEIRALTEQRQVP